MEYEWCRLLSSRTLEVGHSNPANGSSRCCRTAPNIKAAIKDHLPTERYWAHPHHNSSQGYGTSTELCSQPPQLLPPTPTRQLRRRTQGTPTVGTAAHLRQRKQREQEELSPSRRHAGPTAPPPAFVSDRAGPGPFRTGYPSNPPRKFRPGNQIEEVPPWISSGSQWFAST